MASCSVIQTPADRLKVFVSSTIRECAPERAIAREAIRSLNHEPILFEDIGARPHPPRELYRARLEDSQVFVGIYRESYGWVAPDMEISGIEDEFCLASARAMDRLVYVFANPASRDPQLQGLIDRAMNAGITVAFYSDPAELRDRIRDDLTAVVSSRYVEQAVVEDEVVGARELLDSLLPNPHHRFRRLKVEAALRTTLDEVGRLTVSGPLGAGKTVLLAQLASEHDWIFVDGRGLTRIDALARATNAVRARLGQHRLTFSTEQSAKLALSRAWRSLDGEVLAVDAAPDPEVFWDLPASQSRLVLTTRRPMEVPAPQRFNVPVLSREEIGAWITALRGKAPEPGELIPLLDQSGGNPLFLRFYALGEPHEVDLSLRDLEIRALQALSPRAREVVTYLALAGTRLSLPDLQHLLEVGAGPEVVIELINEASVLLRQHRDGVELVHEHPRQSLLEHLRGAPTRLGFFSSRLGTHLEATGDYVRAFHIYLEAGASDDLDRILNSAAFQAARRGGGALAIEIFGRKAAQARDFGRVEEEVRGWLGLAQALQQTGARDDARHALDAARTVAQQSGDDDLLLDVHETALVADIPHIDSSERINGLRALQQARAERGLDFDAARTATLLSAEYIAAGDYPAAEAACRLALGFFERVGDEYGIHIARINLVAALSGIAGRERDVAEMTQLLHEATDPAEYPRERAVICNILTRRHRDRGNTAAAAAFAAEAIQIGQTLGDQHVIAINRVNLGNVRRDENQLDEALEEYRAADRAAAKGNLRRDEAAANELIASVLNQQGKPELAHNHAQHAVSLARLAGDPILESRAEEERAIAFVSQRNVDAAVTAYVSAARAIASVRSDRGTTFASLVSDALAVGGNAARPDLTTRALADLFAPSAGQSGDAAELDRLAVLFEALPNIARSATAERVQPLVSLAVADLLEAAAPRRVQQRIVMKAIESLLDQEHNAGEESVLASVAALLMTATWDSFSLSDLTRVAERLTATSAGLYFKPYPDGASHWTVRVQIAGGVTATIVQLDDSPRTFIVGMGIALLLASLGPTIRRRLLDAEDLPRREVVLNVISRAEFDANIEPEVSGLRELPSGFTVSQSTDVTKGDQPPIVVICEDTFGEPWRPNRQRLSDSHLLFAHLLTTLASHLLAKQIEADVLFPKVKSLVQRLGFQGQLQVD
jgi:tetratricopeptide (TPR) repeat protein